MIQPDPPPGFEPVGPVGRQPDPPPGFEPVQTAGQPEPPPGFGPVGVIAPTPESRNMIQSGLLDPLGRGLNQLTSSGAALGARLGVISADTAAGQIAQDQADMLQYPVQPNVQAGMQRIQDAGAARGGVPGVFDALGQAVQEPRVLGDVVVQSIPASSPAIAGGAAGALAGSALGPPGVVGGAMIGSFLGGMPTEFGNTIVEKLQEARIPLTRDNIARALQDPAFIDEATRSGLIRGATIGAVDAASLGAAGRVFGPVARTVGGAAGRVPGAVAGGAAEVGLQGVAGAVGEGLAQTFDDGRITKPAEVALEGAAGAATTIPDILTMRAARGQQGQPAPAPEQPAPPPGFEPVQTPEPPRVEAPPVQPVPAPEPPTPPSPEPAPEPATPPITPQPAPEPPAAATGQRMSRFSTPDNVNTFEAPFEVVDLSTLRGATDDLQPRDRETRAASDQQILDISNRLNPAQLIDDPVSDRGSPIVDENSTILSGNGRVAALELASRNNPERFEAYRQALRDQGFNVDGVQTPVLVRRLAGLAPEAKRDFVIRSNEDTKLSYSPGELAKIDGSRISEDMLRGFNTDSDTGVLSPANRGFVREFMGRLNKNQQNALMTAGGQLNPQGQRRLENALFARAYDNPDLVTRVVENEEGGGLRNALLSSAPAWAQMRAVGDKRFDITPQLTRAVDAYADMRTRGVKLNDYLAKQDAFDPLPPEAETLLRLMHNPSGNRVAAWRDVRDVLKEYSRIVADEARAVGRIDGAENQPGEILRGILARRDKGEDVGGGQGGMFSRETPDNRPEPMVDSDQAVPAPREGDRIPRGSLTPDYKRAMTFDKGPRSFELFRDAGIDPVDGANMPAQQQLVVLAKALANKFRFRSVADNNVAVTGKAETARAIDARDGMLVIGRNAQAMASALNLPLNAIGLNGTLSLSFTSGRKGRRYFGAFYGSSMHIDIAGRSNVFAHEWMHALDHYVLSDILAMRDPEIAKLIANAAPNVRTDMTTALAREAGPTTKDRLQLAFVRVINAMYFEDGPLALEMLRLQMEATYTDATGNPTPRAQIAMDKLDAIAKGNFKDAALDSRFLKNSTKFGSRFGPDMVDYYTSPVEMFARVGEAYVAARATQAGMDKDLAGIAKKDQLYTQGVDLRLVETFPKAEERARVFQAMDELFAALADDAVFGTTPARPVDETEVYDPTVWTKAVAARPGDPLWKAIGREFGTIANGVTRIAKGDGAAVAGEFKVEVARRAGAPDKPIPTRVSVRDQLLGGVSTIFLTIRGKLKMLTRAVTDDARPYFQNITDTMADDPGTGRYVEDPFNYRIMRERKKTTSAIGALLAANDMPTNGRLPGTTAETVRELMLGKRPAGATSEMRRVAFGLRQIMDGLYRKMTAAGLDIGYVKDTGYLSRTINPVAVDANRDGFVTQATKVEKIVFDRDVNLTPGGNIGAQFEALNEKRRQVLGLKKYTDDLRASSTASQAEKTFLSTARAYGAALRADKKASTPQTAAKLQTAEKAFRDAMVAFAGELRPVWSDMMATRWMEHTLAGQGGTNTSVDASFMKERKLPAEADTIMKDFYEQDPVAAVMRYAEQAERKLALLDKFGNVAMDDPTSGANDLDTWLGRKNIQLAIAARPKYYNENTPTGRLRIIDELIPKAEANTFEMKLREASRGGATPDQLDAMRNLMRTVAGLQRGGNWADESRAASVLYATGTLALLPRAAWSAIMEPLTAGLRTGDVGATLKTMTAFVRETVRSAKDVKDLQVLAEHIGLITSPYYEAVVNHQLSSQANDPLSIQMGLSAFFQRTGLTHLTNASKRAAIAGSWHWFTKLADSVKNPKAGWGSSAKARADSARAEFRELGIPDDKIDDWVDWVLQNNGKLPTIDQLDGEVGRLFEIAMTRLNKQIVQEPTIVDKPVFAAHPWGRMVYAIMSFPYSFTRSIHLRTVLKAARDYDIERADGRSTAGAASKVGLTATGVFVGGFTALILGQLMTTIVREAIFNGEAWEEREKEEGREGVERWLLQLAFSRSGIAGAFDPILQAYTGLRYERDLTALAAGAHLSFFLNTGLQTFGGLLTERNSPNTNTSEYKAVKAAYQTIAAPAISLGLSLMPGGPFIGALAGVGIQGLTSNAMADNVAEAIVGEKGSPTGAAAQRGGSRF